MLIFLRWLQLYVAALTFTLLKNTAVETAQIKAAVGNIYLEVYR